MRPSSAQVLANRRNWLGTARRLVVVRGDAGTNERPHEPPQPANFRILGPLDVRWGGRAVELGSPKHRVLLASLLLTNGQPVSVSHLADAIWGPAQPSHPRRAVQLCVTRLRSDLAAVGVQDVIVTCADGYSIHVPTEDVDLGRFQYWLGHAERAAGQADPDGEAAALANALALWRGEPLSDVPSELLQREVVPRLREQRLRALERRLDLDLSRGRHADLIGELVELTAQSPLRERLWAQLMTALYRGGRRSDALAAFQAARRQLVDELGVDPGEELQRLHRTVLAGCPDSVQPGWAASPRVARDLPSLPTVPRQLPPEAAGFAGRDKELARIHALLDGGATRDAVVVVAVVGGAGVGKTALAVHWSRQAADRFPDGQLWADLRGYHPGHALTPAQALERFLRALGVPAADVPSEVDEQAALYRSLMDGRRMLIVLDNAMGADQIRPLVPGAAGCVVLVTSRSRLSGLVAADGAHLLVLDRLSRDDARDLLSRRLGTCRTAADARAVEEIVSLCARLPLALTIVAARRAASPELRLEALAERLGQDRGSLDVFTAGESAVDVRTSFWWSYRTLGPDTARLFRLLGVHPEPDISLAAAATLAGVPLPAVRPMLEVLCCLHLVTERIPGRYAVDGLLRAYAAELAAAHDAGPLDTPQWTDTPATGTV